MTDPVEKQIRPNFGEIGVTGLKVWGGYIQEEFLTELRGQRAYRIYDEMSKNDPTVGAILNAIDLLVRAAEWEVEPANDTPAAKAEAEFVTSLMDDMSGTWEDFISEAMTMLVFGWSFFEHVWKRRVGPNERDPKRRSKYSDGLIGIRKFASRAQDTLDRWNMQEDGGVSGWVQMPITGYTQPIYLPIKKGMLFRTVTRKNNPEGMSILRSAYTSWYRLKQIQSYEAVGIERELAGLPILYAPNSLLKDTSEAGMAAINKYKQLVRDVRLNEQGGAIIPSDVYEDAEGKPSTVRQFEMQLLSTGGRRAIDTDKVVLRYQRDIARSVLADFIMMGSEKVGSYALADNKTSLFLTSIETHGNNIAAVLNRYMLPRLWDLNGKNRDLMPSFRPGSVSPTDLTVLGQFLESMTTSGFSFSGDGPLEEFLRDEAGLPPRPNDLPLVPLAPEPLVDETTGPEDASDETTPPNEDETDANE